MQGQHITVHMFKRLKNLLIEFHYKQWSGMILLLYVL